MNKTWKAWMMLFCVFSMLFQQHAYAQAALAPVENYVVNRAVGGIIANRMMVARGVAANDSAWIAAAANDPVYKATMAGVGSTMTAANAASTALGVGLAIAGAPVWLTVAASLGVVAVGSYIAYSASADANFSVIASGSGNKIQVTNKPTALPTYSAGTSTGYGYGIDWAIANGANVYRDPSSCVQGSPCYELPPLPASVPMKIGIGCCYQLVASNATDLARYWVKITYDTGPNPVLQSYGVTFVIESAGAGFTYSDDGTPHWYVWIHESRQGCALPLCDPTTDLPNYDRTYFTYPSGGQFSAGSYPAVFQDLDSASAAIGSDLRAAKVSPTLLANMVDKAWQQAAAKPGYAGEPYPASQPVSVSDVSIWKAANPTANPSLDDLLRPAQNLTTNPEGVPISPTVQAVTSSASSTGTNGNVNVINTPNVNVVNNVKVDFGPDPGTADPALETTPTGDQILAPLTGLFPELRSFQTPVHSGDCPKPSFDIFGKAVVMDSQCTIAEQHRAALAAVMMCAWLMLGLFIVLSA